MAVLGTGEPFRGYAAAMTPPKYHADSKWSKCDTSPRYLTSVSSACPAKGVEVMTLADLCGRAADGMSADFMRPHPVALQRGRLRHTIDFTGYDLEPGDGTHKSSGASTRSAAVTSTGTIVSATPRCQRPTDSYRHACSRLDLPPPGSGEHDARPALRQDLRSRCGQYEQAARRRGRGAGELA
jgi:hypothetical protein